MMNGLVAPKPPLTALPRWTRHAELLVYLVPVGTISAELYDGYVALLQRHRTIAIRSLTRPGGYAAELSPFRSFAWDGDGTMRFRFVSTTDKIDAFDGEDVHACARAVGVIGICHCPTTPSLPAAYHQFMESIRHFPGLLVHKCFAFEHQFDLRTVEECAALTHIVMFPVYHELDQRADGSESPMAVESSDIGAPAAVSTVSLHLGVVLDTLCVTVLMSLESTVRAATRQMQTQLQGATTPSSADALLDVAGFLLDTNVEPSHTHSSGGGSGGALSPFPVREPTSGPSTPTNDRPSTGGGAGGVAALFGSAETRQRRRHAARQRKLFGDYAVLVSCIPDAIEQYVTAIELLREEERRSGGAPGDVLWLAAALEGYVFCLYEQSQDKFMVEIVEKASEAIALYAKAGVSELEIALVEHMGWYYTSVAVQLSSLKGPDKVEEAIWTKRLLWEVIDRGVAVFSDIPVPRQVEFLVNSATMLEAVGHYRRMAMVLHEANALILQRWRPQHASLVASPSAQTSLPHQRVQDLRVAMHLEQISSQRLGMASRDAWESTSLRRRGRRLRNLQRRGALAKVTVAMASAEVEPWLSLRFHILRQLIAIAKAVNDPYSVGLYCIELLRVLSWCDSIAQSSGSTDSPSAPHRIDQLQLPYSLSRSSIATTASSRLGLHARSTGSTAAGYSGVYTTPPASIETKAKRYFSMLNSPSATMSSAAASITSTIANTPRVLLSTPRQQLSAAVNAISTKATPAFSSFSNAHTTHSSPSSAAATTPGRSASASTANELINGPSAGFSTNRSSLSDSIEPAMSQKPTPTADPVPVSIGSDGFSSPTWDLRSKAELHRLERQVLGVLETECTIMRPSEQVKLSAFVEVHKMRVLYDDHHHPILKSTLAREKYGTKDPSSASSSGSPAFFYNPFDAQRTKASSNPARRHSWSGSESDGSGDEDHSTESAGYERCFPAHEPVHIEVVISNPYGIELDLQQIAAWVSASPANADNREPTAISTVEAYPSSVALAPYERRKRIVLRVCALEPGAFFLRGCFIKCLNVKTSFRLKSEIPLTAINTMPVLSSALLEIGSLTEETKAIESTTSTSQQRGGEGADAATTSTPICMFANEAKRCVLRIRNTGHDAVKSLCLLVRVGKIGSSGGGLSRGVPVHSIFRSEMTSQPQLKSDRMAIETDGLILTCVVDHKLLASLLPLERDGSLAVPMEISLKGPSNGGIDRYQLQWTFVYNSHGDVEEPQVTSALFSRESQHIVTLVPLPSLAIHRVQVVAKTSISMETTDDVPLYDDDRCFLVLDVVNPTETVFLLRVVRASEDSKDDWDVEVGRMSSRRVVIELVRLHSSEIQHGVNISDVLNQHLRVQWKTYFGTTGHLSFHEGLWTDEEKRMIAMQLMRAELSLCVNAGDGLTREFSLSSALEEVTQDTPRFPFRFYQSVGSSSVAHDTDRLVAKLCEPCTLAVEVRSRWSRQVAPSSLRIDVLVQHESDTFICEDVEDNGGDEADEEDVPVMISGLTTKVIPESEMNNSLWQWSIQCVFLTEGTFTVALRARYPSDVSSGDHGNQEEIWSHRVLRIRSVSM